MKLVIFGLSVSSSWGNGHATLWRGLCRSLSKLGAQVVFFERDVPYYASTRDLWELPGGGDLVLYPDWNSVSALASRHVAEADVAIVTSYCPDAIAASDLILDSNAALRVFYDLDTGVTLARMAACEPVSYVGPRGYRDYDLVLSYTGGQTLELLQSALGAPRVAALYGSADPEVHFPSPPDDAFKCNLSYLGTYSADRDDALRLRLLQPAQQLPAYKFFIGGSQYVQDFPWLPNIFYAGHVAPAQHPAFYCSSQLTLNVTRAPMAAMGYCPSGRLFEAAACGIPVLSDEWPGIHTFYEPDSEILIVNSASEAIRQITRPAAELAAIGRAARERTLSCHTSDIRAAELESLLTSAYSQRHAPEAVCGA